MKHVKLETEKLHKTDQNNEKFIEEKIFLKNLSSIVAQSHK